MRIRFSFTPTPDPTERHDPDPPRWGFEEIRELEYPEGQIEDAKRLGVIDLVGVSNKVNEYKVTAYYYEPFEDSGLTDGLVLEITNVWPAAPK